MTSNPSTNQPSWSLAYNCIAVPIRDEDLGASVHGLNHDALDLPGRRRADLVAKRRNTIDTIDHSPHVKRVVLLDDCGAVEDDDTVRPECLAR